MTSSRQSKKAAINLHVQKVNTFQDSILSRYEHFLVNQFGNVFGRSGHFEEVAFF